ncbi:crosslink repair DNA glycosylase YcaQ family protein [Sorangium cellulosum]
MLRLPRQDRREPVAAGPHGDGARRFTAGGFLLRAGWYSGCAPWTTIDKMAKAHLEHETVDGKVYWFAVGQAICGELDAPLVHLLPNYDEYVIAYKDHSATLDPALSSRAGDALMAHLVVLDGRVVGGWRRAIQKKAVAVTMNLPLRPKKGEKAALQRPSSGTAGSWGRLSRRRGRSSRPAW